MSSTSELSFLNNEYFLAVATILVVVYGTMSNIELPPYVRGLFKNDIFRVAFLSLLCIYRFNSAPHVALIIALVFVLTMYFLNLQEKRENFQYLEAFKSNIRSQ
jgi:hypothetical protein